MPAGNVWLLLIPIFGILWQFVVVNKLGESIRDECVALNIDTKHEKPTFISGLAYAISNVLILVPVLRGVFSFLFIFTWIAYWVKVHEYKKLIVLNSANVMLDAEKDVFFEGSK